MRQEFHHIVNSVPEDENSAEAKVTKNGRFGRSKIG